MATWDAVYGQNTPVVSDAGLNELRTMAAASPTDWDNATLTLYAQKYPLVDDNGRNPNDLDWKQSYDLHAAAEKIWVAKAATHVECFDFSADGASYSRSQVYENCMKQASYHASRKAPRSLRVVVDIHFERDFQADPKSVLEGGSGDTMYLMDLPVINLPEPEDD